MISRFLGAVQFLTILPVPGSTAAPGASAAFFPLVGAAIGYTGAAAWIALQQLLPPGVAAIAVLGWWALLTGGLHEDGFADVVDAFRAGRSRDRILGILKDSRIGAHGALALVVITILRWQALASIAAQPVLTIPAVFAVSRAAMVALAWIAPPVGGGLGFEFSQRLTSTAACGAIALAVVISCVAPAGLLMLWGACLIVALARVYFGRRIGGVNGDCLGATSLMVETWGLVLYSCRRCL